MIDNKFLAEFFDYVNSVAGANGGNSVFANKKLNFQINTYKRDAIDSNNEQMAESLKKFQNYISELSCNGNVLRLYATNNDNDEKLLDYRILEDIVAYGLMKLLELKSNELGILINKKNDKSSC